MKVTFSFRRLRWLEVICCLQLKRSPSSWHAVFSAKAHKCNVTLKSLFNGISFFKQWNLCNLGLEIWPPVGRAITCSSVKWEVWGSSLGPVKSDIVLPTIRHHCGISSKKVVLPASKMTRRWVLQTRYTLQRNAACVINDLVRLVWSRSRELARGFA